MIKNIFSLILKSKAFIFIFVVALTLLASSLYLSTGKKESQEKVLGASTAPITSHSATSTATPTEEPSPTKSVTGISPTLTPTPTSAAKANSTGSNQNPTSTTNTNTATPTSTPTDTPTPTPTPAGLTIQVKIDYAGQRAGDAYTVSAQPGQTAWDAVVKAVGLSNLQYDQYSFGNFITGFNGISADPNSQFYAFSVNGASSNVGVSDYQVQEGDTLSFALTSF